AGFDPAYPPGEAGCLLPMGGSFGVRLSGGANHTLGSLVVVDPARGTAHHVTNGFAAYAQELMPALGGRPALAALGAPLEAERSVDQNHSVQRFTHGELHWTPSQGVWVEPPDLFAQRASSLPPP